MAQSRAATGRAEVFLAKLSDMMVLSQVFRLLRFRMQPKATTTLKTQSRVPPAQPAYHHFTYTSLQYSCKSSDIACALGAILVEIASIHCDLLRNSRPKTGFVDVGIYNTYCRAVRRGSTRATASNLSASRSSTGYNNDTSYRFS